MPSVRKAVIPAAGLGTRLLPATKALPKEMLPVVDRPAIQYVIEEAARAGIEDVLVVTATGKSAIEDHFDRAPALETSLRQAGKDKLLASIEGIADLVQLHYVRQGEPLGLGHAVSVARSHVGDEPFAVLLPDDLMAADSTVLSDMISACEQHQSSVIALKPYPLQEISAYGSADCTPMEGDASLVRVHGVVEKPAPEDAPSDLAMMGRYVFTPEIFDALARTPPGVGGEIQLTDAVGLLLAEQQVLGHVFTSGRMDIGKKLDYLCTIVELALEREDLSQEFGAFLADVVKRRDLG